MSTDTDFKQDATQAVEHPGVQSGVTIEQDFAPLIPEVVKESKAGYKTTEFWVSVVSAFLLAVGALPTPHDTKGFAVAAIVGLYAVARGLAKKGVPVVEPVQE